MSILLLIGSIIIWYYGIQLSLWIYCLFFRKNSLQKYKSSPNGKSWAIATGSTAGIGLAFCEVSLKCTANHFIIFFTVV